MCTVLAFLQDFEAIKIVDYLFANHESIFIGVRAMTGQEPVQVLPMT